MLKQGQRADVGMVRGLRLDPTDAPALGNLGVAKLANGEVAAGLQLLQRSYDLGFAPLGPMLAKTLWVHGDKDRAADIWLESRESLAGRYLPEFETQEGWARPNAYRLGLMLDAGLTAEAFRLLQEKPFPISAGFVTWLWVATGDVAAPSADASFPDFAKEIGLVEAWEEYGWPTRCSSMPALGKSVADFWCE